MSDSNNFPSRNLYTNCQTIQRNGNDSKLLHEKKDFAEILRYLIRMNQTSPSRRLRISIEGNIASGKTTIIKYLKEVVENSNRSQATNKLTDYDLNENSSEINLVDSCLLFNQRCNVKIIPEPVDLWRNLNGNNLLELMYKDPQRWALAFHSYVQLTMLENHLRLNERGSSSTPAALATSMPFGQQQQQQPSVTSVLSPKASNNQMSTMNVQSPTKSAQQTNNMLSPSKYNKSNLENQSPIKMPPAAQQSTSEPFNINIMERSLFSARYCFVENLYRCNVLKSLEYEILDKWFNWMTEAHDCNLDVIFYLKTNPETCLQRLNKRGRSEETTTVSLDYLRKINDLHEEWLSDYNKLNNKEYYKPPRIIVIDADQSIDDVYKSMELETRNAISMRV